MLYAEDLDERGMMSHLPEGSALDETVCRRGWKWWRVKEGGGNTPYQKLQRGLVYRMFWVGSMSFLMRRPDSCLPTTGISRWKRVNNCDLRAVLLQVYQAVRRLLESLGWVMTSHFSDGRLLVTITLLVPSFLSTSNMVNFSPPE